jgi:type I restriction-modification system DNA methylase subunit
VIYIPYSKEEAKQEVYKLINDFRVKFPKDVPKTFNEENTKDWLDELFRILGWIIRIDVDKEEIVGKRKRVDYSFKIEGTTQFLLEAKKPSENLDDHIEQAVTYGYQKSKKWVVLSNFEEIRIYNSQYWDEPEEIKRLFAPLKINDFLTRFDDLWLLSKQAFQEHLIEEVAKKYGKIKPKEPITEQLSNDLGRWRGLITRSINDHKRLNEQPIESEKAEEWIDEAVQRIIDRIIFIRVVEDKNLEEPILEQAIKDWKIEKKKRLMEFLKIQFRKMDDTYNSGLFREHYSENLSIDDEVLEKVIQETYKSPNGLPYDFAVIDADILGSVYEQYLSLLLRKTAKRTSLKQSAGKRREQGIYYTPPHIVEYIVKNTLGNFLYGKAESKIEKIKVLDPACGSGSFLIKAFDQFKPYYKNKGGQQKMNPYSQILTEHLYGVDLDTKAVEIAQLNLLLKAAETKHKLPELDDNIKCGNSLIETNLSEEKHPFNWKEKFEEIMKKGGFDIIIGNPPYGVAFSQGEREYFKANYPNRDKDINSFVLFIEKTYYLLKKGGRLGFIIPKNFVKTDDYENIRKFILTKTHLKIVADFGKSFREVTGEMVVIILEKTDSPDPKTIIETYDEHFNRNTTTISQKTFLGFDKFRINLNISPETTALVEQVRKNSVKVGSILKIIRGVETGKKDNYITLEKRPNCIPIVAGKDIDRYVVRFNRWMSYLPDKIEFKDESVYKNPKILIRKIAGYIHATFDNSGLYTTQGVYCLFGLPTPKLKHHLAILNSKLIRWYYNFYFNMDAHLTTNVTIENIRNLYTKEASNSQLIQLVDNILQINQRLSQLKNKPSNETHQLEMEIKIAEDKIDQIVYDLYGLSPNQIKIVKESISSE